MRSLKKAAIIKILPLLYFTLPVMAQRNYPDLLDKYINSFVALQQFNGCVLVAKEDSVIYKKAFGFKDFDNKYTLDNDAEFELGTMTEQFTAAAIMLLRDQGKLNITDPITKYLNTLPYHEVTIEHLLTHSSGLPDYYAEVMRGKWIKHTLATNDDIIHYLSISNVPLHFKPGRKYEMCFTDFPLLASIIEKVSGETYTEYLEQNFFIPLHLSHTKVETGLLTIRKNQGGYVEGIPYDPAKQSFVPSDSIKQFDDDMLYITDGIVGGTGIRSTTSDLYTWFNALKHGTWLKTESAMELFEPKILKDSSSKVYRGLGFLTGRTEEGEYELSYDNGNTILGFSGSIINYQQRGVLTIVLCNKTTNTSRFGGELAYIMFDADVMPIYVHKAVEIDSGILSKYVGRYATPNQFELIKKEGTLYLRFTEEPWEPDLKFLPESQTKFFSASGEYDYQIEFETDNNGDIKKVYMISKGLKKQIKKLN